MFPLENTKITMFTKKEVSMTLLRKVLIMDLIRIGSLKAYRENHNLFNRGRLIYFFHNQWELWGSMKL